MVDINGTTQGNVRVSQSRWKTFLLYKFVQGHSSKQPVQIKSWSGTLRRKLSFVANATYVTVRWMISIVHHRVERLNVNSLRPWY